MKKLILPVLFILLIGDNFSIAQYLSPERILKIKNCTVHIIIDGVPATGTGFFINTLGQVLTCWHVIDPAIIKDSLNRITGLKKIFIVLNNGEKIEVGISSYFLEKGNEEAYAFDFCLLNQLVPRTTPFLKFGDFDKVLEGEEIYTCGFPLGMQLPFVSKGMVSTKFIDTLNSINHNGKTIRMPRTQALLDITLNGGNSGGAIIKIGKTIDEDEVIGLADYIVNPIGDNNANNLINLFSKGVGKYNLEGVDPNKTFIYFTQIISSLSLGISGCISTNHFLIALSNIKN